MQKLHEAGTSWCYISWYVSNVLIIGLFHTLSKLLDQYYNTIILTNNVVVYFFFYHQIEHSQCYVVCFRVDGVQKQEMKKKKSKSKRQFVFVLVVFTINSIFCLKYMYQTCLFSCGRFHTPSTELSKSFGAEKIIETSLCIWMFIRVCASNDCSVLSFKHFEWLLVGAVAAVAAYFFFFFAIHEYK